MSLVIADDLIQASGLSEQELLLEIVLMLFHQDKISLGKASEIMGLYWSQFQQLLADQNLYIHYDVAEFQEDLKTLQEMDWSWKMIILETKNNSLPKMFNLSTQNVQYSPKTLAYWYPKFCLESGSKPPFIRLYPLRSPRLISPSKSVPGDFPQS